MEQNEATAQAGVVATEGRPGPPRFHGEHERSMNRRNREPMKVDDAACPYPPDMCASALIPAPRQFHTFLTSSRQTECKSFVILLVPSPWSVAFVASISAPFRTSGNDRVR